MIQETEWVVEPKIAEMHKKFLLANGGTKLENNPQTTSVYTLRGDLNFSELEDRGYKVGLSSTSFCSGLEMTRHFRP